jgi:uncharacterized membrane protein YqhA
MGMGKAPLETAPAGTPAQRAFEHGLWSMRLLALVAVVASVLMAIGAFVMATIDVLYLVAGLWAYTDLDLSLEAHNAVRTKLVTFISEALDSYLIATLLLVFAFGLHELFIRSIRVADRSAAGPRLLRFESIDDLKDRVFKLILLLLVVQFFDEVLEIGFHSPQEVLLLGGGIFLVGVAFFLSNLRLGKGH